MPQILTGVLATFGQLLLLKPDDLTTIYAMLDLFGEVFDDLDLYARRRPDPNYLRQLLAGDSFIAIVATRHDSIVGGVAAYELRKFEQQRSEIYIYDLAVRSGHRRQGIATRIINELQNIAASRIARVIFVQAGTSEEDQPAIALYSKLGTCEDVLHFDFPIRKAKK